VNRYNHSIVKVTAASILILTLAPILHSQTVPSKADCKPLVMQSGSTPIEEAKPQKVDTYRRPPMVAYEVQEDGNVRKLRVVRHSGSKELDEKLFSAASHWKYEARAGCGSTKVPLSAGPISDEGTALRVAEPELIRAYGRGIIASERPLTAVSWGKMWTVGGTVHCSHGKRGTAVPCVGGVATLHLSKEDGRIVKIFHTE
jgi:TonB family protein